MKILLSYPRCGNHLCRFFIELLSEKPTFGCIGNELDKQINQNIFAEKIPFNISTYDRRECYYKFHGPLQIYSNLTTTNLILIVRNPKEALLRQCNYKFDINSFEIFFKNLDYYHQFKGKKLLLYYEDMITHRKEFINQLYHFLSLTNETKKQYVMNNIDKLFDLSLGAKYSAWGGNISNNQLNFYYKQIPPKIKVRFTRYINNKFKKYPILQRYRN